MSDKKKREMPAGELRMPGGNVSVPATFWQLAPVDRLLQRYRPSETSDDLYTQRQVEAVEQVIHHVTVAVRTAKKVFMDAGQPCSAETALELLDAFRRGGDDMSAGKLIAAAALILVYQELVAALPNFYFEEDEGEPIIQRKDGSDLPDGTATWRTVFLAAELTFWLGKLEAHHEVHGIRGTRKAAQAKKEAPRRMMDALLAAIDAGIVANNLAGAMAWEAEQARVKKRPAPSRATVARHLRDVRKRLQSS